MLNPLPNKVVGNSLANNETNSNRATFTSTMTEKSELAEWEKSVFLVNLNYDLLIYEAAQKGYEFYDALPEDLKFELVMEIIKTEGVDAFYEYGDVDLLTEFLTEIMLTKGDSKSFTDLYDYLQGLFIDGLGKKPACFASKITLDLETQIEKNEKYDIYISKYGDPDDWKYDIKFRDSYLSLKEEVSHG